MNKLYLVNTYVNFLSKNKTKTLVDFGSINLRAIPCSIFNSGELVITPYPINLKESKLAVDTLRDISWHGDNNTDLKSWSSTDGITKKLLKYNDIKLIGALEWIEDIRPILKSIRDYLLRNPNGKVTYLKNPKEFIGHGFRDWENLDDIVELFESSGFRSTLGSKGVVISCDNDYYEKFLSNNFLPNKDIEHIIVTNEHPDFGQTGGIGSYVGEASSLYGKKSAVLILDNPDDKKNNKAIAASQHLSLTKLIGSKISARLIECDHGDSSAATLEAIYQILFLYSNVKVLEGSDYGHLNLSRAIQAKNTGLLPSSIDIITVCHGSNIYVDTAANRYPSKNNIPIIIKESQCIVKSDATIFLTKYLERLYFDHGLVARNPIKRRLPINIEYYKELGIDMPDAFEEVKNIYYIGKLTKMKGADILLEIILRLAKSNKKFNVICASTYNVPEEGIDILLSRIRKYKNINLVIKSYNRDDLIKELNTRAIDSVALVPYPGDNHPNVVLELMLVGMDFIASNAGGIPELIPNNKYFISNLQPKNMEAGLLDIINKREDRFKIVHANRLEYLLEQEKINQTYTLDELYSRINHFKVNNITTENKDNIDKTVTLIVPCYNTDLKYLNDLCMSLRSQSVRPDEVIFVNDGSTKYNYGVELEKLASSKLSGISYKVINKENGGLSSARNQGLLASKTKYIITIDSDDIVDNYFIEYMVNAIIESDFDETIGVTPFLNVFYDELDYTKNNSFHFQYMPYGSNLGTSFFPNNNYGSAAVIFNRERLVRVTGGWDESSKFMYEDWALYIRLNSLGYSVNIMPRASYFYRVRKDSMLRTYNDRDGHMRLIANYSSLPKYETYLLFSQLFNHYNADHRCYVENNTNRTRQEVLQDIFDTYDTAHLSRLVKVSKLLRGYNRYMPYIGKRAVYLFCIFPYRFLKKIYKNIK